MNPVQKAISELKFRIPVPILQEAFTRNRFGQRPLPVGLDASIREQVIDARVRVDCNLVGGTELVIPLDGLPFEMWDPYTWIYRIPSHLVQNRKISQVMSLTFGTPVQNGIAMMGAPGTSSLLNAAAGVMASQAPIPIVSTAYLRLIGENTVLVQDSIALPTNIALRCVVENDPDFTQLRPTTVPHFCKLVELATKGYIYNTLTLEIGMGQLVGGAELGRFREIVDGYADANELYETYLRDVWQRVAIMDDTTSRERLLRSITGGQR